jgi:hypothetical protein
MRAKCFAIKPQASFVDEYKKVFSEQILAKEMSMFRKKIELPISTFEQAEQLIESQKRMLFSSYQHSNSLLFYFLYGTVNYANVVLNKVAYSLENGEFSVHKFNQARELWLKYYNKICGACQKQFGDFDTSTSLTIHRMASCIKHSLLCKNVLIVSDTKFVGHYPMVISEFLGFEVTIQYVSTLDFISSFELYNPDFIIFQLESGTTDFFNEINLLIGNSFPTTTVLFIINAILPLNLIKNRRANVHFYLNPCKFSEEFSPPESNLLTSVVWSVLFLADIERFDFIYPKYTFSKSTKAPKAPKAPKAMTDSFRTTTVCFIFLI